MGNDFGKTPLVSARRAYELNQSPHDRRFEKLPHYDDRSELSKAVHYLNHTKSELQFFLWRAAVGAAIGGFIGLAFISPMSTYSPYVYRKIMMSLRFSEFMPVEKSRIVLGNFMPQYMRAGAIISVFVEGTSWLYDAMIDSNKITKYCALGALQGATTGLLFGNYGYWVGGAMIGLVGGALVCYKPIALTSKQGDFGKSCEYLPHVTEEEKRKFKLQEARLIR